MIKGSKVAIVIALAAPLAIATAGNSKAALVLGRTQSGVAVGWLFAAFTTAANRHHLTGMRVNAAHGERV